MSNNLVHLILLRIYGITKGGGGDISNHTLFGYPLKTRVQEHGGLLRTLPRPQSPVRKS